MTTTISIALSLSPSLSTVVNCGRIAGTSGGAIMIAGWLRRSDDDGRTRTLTYICRLSLLRCLFNGRRPVCRCRRCRCRSAMVGMRR